jgi:hypothetical protein
MVVAGPIQDFHVKFPIHLNLGLDRAVRIFTSSPLEGHFQQINRIPLLTPCCGRLWTVGCGRTTDKEQTEQTKCRELDMHFHVELPSMQQSCCLSRFMVLTLKLPIGPVHIGFSSVGHSYWNSESDIHFRPGGSRKPEPVGETSFCSAGWQPAVSADWQSAERRILEPAADCQSAIRQTASLRYWGCGSAAPGFSVVEKI